MADLRSYKIATINLNAVTNETKLEALKSFIRVSDFDIIFLQEVALTTLQISGYNVVFNVDGSRRGTAIAVRNYFSYGRVERSLDTRIISMRINGVTLINVYAPSGTLNRGARENFFNATLPYYYYNATETVVIGGDFNCVVNAKDATGSNSHSPMLRRFMNASNVSDTWELLHRDQVEFSFIRPGSASRIDRILITQNMQNWLRTAYFAATAFSDHKAYVVRTVLPLLGSPPGRGIWRLQTKILDHPEVIEELALKWTYWVRFRRNHRSWVDWWMSFVKPKLVSFLKWKTSIHNRNFHDTMELYYALLHSTYDRLERDATQLQTVNHIKGLMLNLQRKHTSENHRLGETYIAGEKTSIFHIASRRNRKSETTIKQLQTETGLLTEDGEIQENVSSYFENLYSPGQIEANRNFEPARSIPEGNQVNQQILQEISPQEVLQAIKSSCSRKSPGVDGLPKEFFLKTWQIIGTEFTLILNDVLAGLAPKEFFDGIIVLVKKKNGDGSIQGYRPISLLNVDYKLVSRVLKNRMTEILPLVLSAKQKCSNGRRNIFEATSRILDRICQLKTQNESALLLAFDFDHAFDRVDHRFLASTMEKMNFNQNLIDLLMHFADSSHSRILINGRLSREIKICRSVRQGDPLSMYLFVIYLQPLIDKISTVLPNAILNAYADDISMFVDNESQLQLVIQTFKEFEKISGARLNVGKTLALKIGVVNLSPESEWLQIQDKVKILGIVFTEDFKTTVDINWDMVLKGFQKCLWANNNRCLNLIQKVILINTYVSSKLWYAASVIPLTNKHSGKFISRIGSFLWYGQPWTRIAFETLILPKQRGGLNLHSPPIKAKALLVNRIMHNAPDLPFLWSFVEHNANPPFVSSIPRRYDHIRTVVRETAFLPDEITRNPSSSNIYHFYIQRMKETKIVQESPNRNWKRIFNYVHSKHLTSHQRSIWYMVIHRKILTNELLHHRGRRADPSCDSCAGQMDTLEHRLFGCGVTRQIWNYQKHQFALIDHRFGDVDWIHPSFRHGSRYVHRRIIKMFSIYLCYILDNNEMHSVEGYIFYLNCNM